MKVTKVFRLDAPMRDYSEFKDVLRSAAKGLDEKNAFKVIVGHPIARIEWMVSIEDFDFPRLLNNLREHFVVHRNTKDLAKVKAATDVIDASFDTRPDPKFNVGDFVMHQGDSDVLQVVGKSWNITYKHYSYWLRCEDKQLFVPEREIKDAFEFDKSAKTEEKIG